MTSIDPETNTIGIRATMYPDGPDAPNSLGVRTIMRDVFPRFFQALRNMGFDNVDLEWDRVQGSSSANPGPWRKLFNLLDPRWGP
jgi:hypothetical protein